MGDRAAGHFHAERHRPVHHQAEGEVEHKHGHGARQPGQARHADQQVGDRSENRTENERQWDQKDTEDGHDPHQDRVGFFLRDRLIPLTGDLVELIRPLAGRLDRLAYLRADTAYCPAHLLARLARPHDVVDNAILVAVEVLQAVSLLVPLGSERTDLGGIGVLHQLLPYEILIGLASEPCGGASPPLADSRLFANC
ncbi:hypothetical protein [Micromonospora sp. NPDC049102]|uniref:hypothetical protein n=1 Tax=Micromonospora sp. NPDC049102 TaxID=3364265 RepID=UPI003710723A